MCQGWGAGGSNQHGSCVTLELVAPVYVSDKLELAVLAPV